MTKVLENQGRPLSLLLVGGGSRIPFLQEALADELNAAFGKVTLQPYETRGFHAEFAVVLGAMPLPEQHAAAAGAAQPDSSEPDSSEPEDTSVLEGPVSSLAFDPESMFLAAAAGDTLHIWRLEDGEDRDMEHCWTLTRKEQSINAIAFAPNGTLFAAVENEILSWEAPLQNAPPVSIGAHETAITSIALSTDGLYLASANREKGFKLWNLETGREDSYRTEEVEIRGKRYWFFLEERIRLKEIKRSQVPKTPTLKGPFAQDGRVNTVAFLKYNPLVMVGREDGVVEWYGVPPRETEHSVRPRGTETWEDLGRRSRSPVTCVTDSYNVTSRHRYSISGHADGTLFVHGKAVKRDAHVGRMTAIIVVPLEINRFSFLIATGGVDGTVRLWTLALKKLKPFTYLPYALVTPWLYGLNYKLKSYARLTGHTDSVTSLACSPDGKRLFSGTADGTVRLWNLEELMKGSPRDNVRCDAMLSRPAVRTARSSPR